MPINYSKWANIDDDDEEEAPPSAKSVADLVPAGATELPPGATRAFLNALCEAVFSQFSTKDGLRICSTALRRSLPGVASLDDELQNYVLACHFYFPNCLPPRWQGREQLRLAGEMSARACIAEIMEELQLGVLTREALFKAAGNAPGHPDSAKLEARLQLPPGHMMLVAQLAMPDGTAWLETRQLELPVGVELQIGEPTVEPAQRRRVCGGCGASESPGLVFQACSRCRRQHYCTKDCQVRAWKAGHKGECVAHP